MAHLPGAVHLVAEAPELDSKRIAGTVSDAHVAEFAAAGVIGVFHDIAGILRPPGTQVDGVHELCIRLLGPVGKFMKAYRIRFRGEPGKIQPLGAVGSHAVLPVEAGDKVAAGIADYGDAEIAHLFQHVFAKALFIRHGVTGLVNPAVHCAAQMLNEGAVKARVDPADDVIFIKNNSRRFHDILSD